MTGLDAWGELLEKYFSEDDQEQLEWAIGCVLSEGPKKMMVISGPAASGKSTVLKIIQEIVENYDGNRLPIDIFHDGMRRNADTFAFVASNTPVDGGMMQIQTTGSQHPPRRYNTLVSLIDQDHASVIDHCINVYKEKQK